MIEADLRGKFHAHITVHTDAQQIEVPKGWKQTIILLKGQDGRVQTDVMITRHFMLGSEKNPHLQSIMWDIDTAAMQLSDKGYSVIRKKLEHESLPTLAPSKERYRECHVKIRKPVGLKLHDIDGFVQSRNPMEVTTTHETVFLNARFRSGTVEEADQLADRRVDQFRMYHREYDVVVLEVKKESTVRDSNINLDTWWA